MTVAQRVERECRAIRARLVVGGALVAVAGVSLMLAAGVILLGAGRWATLPAPAPAVVWMLAIAAAGVLLTIGRRGMHRVGAVAAIASAIERERSLRDGSLRGALEVEGRGALARRAADRLVHGLPAAAPLAPALRGQLARRVLTSAGAAMAGAALLLTLSGLRPDGARALAHPLRAWRGTLLPPLAFENLPPMVLRGERLAVRIRAAGRDRVVLRSRATGAAWHESRIQVRGAGLAETTLGPVDADLLLVAGDGRLTSDTMLVRVTDRPFVGEVTLRAVYPAYLARAAEALPAGEPARLPRGTVLQLSGRASTELRDVLLEHTGSGAAISLRADGRSFSGRMRPAESGRWEWRALGASGPIADVPPALELVLVPDSLPVVEIVSPAGEAVAAPGDRVLIRGVASDDHGFASVTVRSWRTTATGRSLPVLSERVSGPAPASWSGAVLLDLAARELLPGDALHVQLTATDNSPWAQIGSSRELVIRVPTLDERREMARDAADTAIARAQGAASAQRELAQRTGDAARSRGERATGGARSDGAQGGRTSTSQGTMSFQQAERMNALLGQQRELEERIEAAREAARQLERELRGAGALDSALARRLAEAQQLLREAITPELAQRLQELQQAVQQLSADQARASLAELAAQQQRLREQLERSAEMLRRAAMEGQMQTLRDEARELADRQNALADSLARTTRDSGNARRARELAERTRNLRRDVDAMRERLERDRATAGPQRMAEATRYADRSATDMQRAAREADAALERVNARATDTSAAAVESSGSGVSVDDAARAPRGGRQRSGAQRSSSRAGRAGDSDSAEEQRGVAGAGAEAARDAASEMNRAADALAEARQDQIAEWKSELTQEMDRAIQELLQLSREEQRLEAEARSPNGRADLSGQQGAVQQGLQRTAERLGEQSRRSTLVSPGSRRAIDEAHRAAEQATQSASSPRAGANETANALRDAAEAMNRAAASLVRDRERAGRASSASGFAEMLAQMQGLGRQQGMINGQAQGILQMPGGEQPGGDGQRQAAARALARAQREVARRLEDLGEIDGSGRAGELARDARQIADALEQGRLDPATAQRQQLLLRRLLDAGRTYDDDDQEQSRERQARTATGTETFTPGDPARGREAQRFREPGWNELRGLSPEERRAVLEYFRRINATTP